MNWPQKLVHLPANDMSGLKLILNVSFFSVYIKKNTCTLILAISRKKDFFLSIFFKKKKIKIFSWNRHLILVMDSGAKNSKFRVFGFWKARYIELNAIWTKKVHYFSAKALQNFQKSSISLATYVSGTPIHHYLVFTITVVVVYSKVHFLVELKMLITSEHKKKKNLGSL